MALTLNFKILLAWRSPGHFGGTKKPCENKELVFLPVVILLVWEDEGVHGFPNNIYFLKVNDRNTRSMFKVNNKNTRTTLVIYFTPFSSVSIVDLEQVNVS